MEKTLSKIAEALHEAMQKAHGKGKEEPEQEHGMKEEKAECPHCGQEMKKGK